MISTYGLPTTTTLKLIERERETFETSIEKNALNAREIEGFRTRIGNIQTVDALVEDYEIYSFVMKAFNLQDQMFGKAMMKKVLASDRTDSSSLINKMTDSRFKEIYDTLGFTEGGTKNPNVKDSAWVEKVVERYVDQKLINGQLETNETVGNVLHIQLKAPNVSSWYTVLADTKLQDFFFTALNLPDALKGTELESQVATLKKKFDLSTLNDPGVLEKLTTRYVAIADAKAAQTNALNNPILQLFSSSSSTQQSITAINLDGLSLLRTGRY